MGVPQRDHFATLARRLLEVQTDHFSGGDRVEATLSGECRDEIVIPSEILPARNFTRGPILIVAHAREIGLGVIKRS